ncbi:MAG: tetratricopeptide repeat protein [Pyrinomonadaceae bacterium]
MKIYQRLALFFVLSIFIFHPVSALAKDEWIRVQSKNFNLIGDASEKDIRGVATKLEQFREVFGQIFAGIKFNSAIQTNVVVFKSNSAYKPFKPKRADGKIDDFLAGYFQPGDDVNYITLSTEGEDARTFEVIFHEYVHFLVNTNIGKSNVPPWFNEGLAEYYSTFAIENNQKVELGIFKQNHIDLLTGTKLLPLETLFNVSNYQLHEQGNHSRSIFYAESWALIHYFMQNGKSDELGKFLQLLMNAAPPEKAFQDSFQMTYAQMEKQLKNYVAQSSYKYIYIPLKTKLVFDDEMKTMPVSESEADAYLGDLLYHIRRMDDAEPFLQKSVALNDKQSAAYATLGMVKFRQAKYDEAKNYLEKAVSGNATNAVALYYYAYALSRGDGENAGGFVSKFSPETTAKMRDALKKSIALNPTFAPSYDLLAFVGLVNGENLDEALQMLRKALAIEPGNQQFALRIAEIYMRQEKFDEAEKIAEKIAETSDEPQIKSRAESLKTNIENYHQSRAQFEASRKQYEEAAKNNGGQQPRLVRQSANVEEKPPTPEELAKIEAEERMISLNQAVRKPEAGEKQVVGHITKVVCASGKITFAVKTDSETILLSSKDFESLSLVTFSKESETAQIGCAANLANFNAVLTFKESANSKSGIRGKLAAIDFVPNDFRFVDTSKSRAIAGTTESDNSTASTPPNQAAIMSQALKNSMRQPQAGEKREQGFIEKVECDNKGMTFFFKTETQVLKLSASSPAGLQIRAYTRKIQQSQFGCAMKQVDVPVVFTYKPNSDANAKTDGEIVALEFMPKDFKLEN